MEINMMTLAQMTIDDWQATRDAIHAYSQVLGSVRKAYALREKHWWHVSLRPTVVGWTTTPVQIGAVSAELTLNLIHHQLTTQTSNGDNWHIPLTGQSNNDLYAQLQAQFATIGVDLTVNTNRLSDTSHSYDANAASQIWAMQAQAAYLLQQLKSSFRHESSPVQLWPHHFDISLVWLSGNLIDGQDPDNEEYADEQMSFGFGTGDSLIAQPYFYSNAYPMPAGLRDIDLPAGYWPREGFGGALLKHSDGESAETVLNFFQTIHQAGKARMLS